MASQVVIRRGARESVSSGEEGDGRSGYGGSHKEWNLWNVWNLFENPAFLGVF